MGEKTRDEEAVGGLEEERGLGGVGEKGEEGGEEEEVGEEGGGVCF